MCLTCGSIFFWNASCIVSQLFHFTFYISDWPPVATVSSPQKPLDGLPISYILRRRKKSWVNEQRWWLLISKNLWKRSLEINNKRGFPLHWLRNTYYDVHCENMKRSLPMNTEKYNWKWQFISIHHHRFVQIVLILVCVSCFSICNPQRTVIWPEAAIIAEKIATNLDVMVVTSFTQTLLPSRCPWMEEYKKWWKGKGCVVVWVELRVHT